MVFEVLDQSNVMHLHSQLAWRRRPKIDCSQDARPQPRVPIVLLESADGDTHNFSLSPNHFTSVGSFGFNTCMDWILWTRGVCPVYYHGPRKIPEG